jgi:hypothetical protein
VVLTVAAFGLCCALWVHVDREQLAWPDAGEALPPSCWFHRLTALQCPTCGLSRSFVASLQGRWDTAWSCHPAGPLWAAAALALFAVTLWSTWRRRRHVWQQRWFWTAAEALAVLSLLLGLLRSWTG